MMVVDTSVLSLAFRRRTRGVVEAPIVEAFRRMVEEDLPVAIPGIVLQELLSGVRTGTEFERLQEVMRGFPVLLATEAHHATAARISNKCRRSGLSVSVVDCLIAATALELNAQLLTTDEDFARMAAIFDLRLFGHQKSAADSTE